jgi:hypothetical protein
MRTALATALVAVVASVAGTTAPSAMSGYF